MPIHIEKQQIKWYHVTPLSKCIQFNIYVKGFSDKQNFSLFWYVLWLIVRSSLNKSFISLQTHVLPD